MTDQKPSKEDIDKAVGSYTQQIEQAPNMREVLKAYEAAGRWKRFATYTSVLPELGNAAAEATAAIVPRRARAGTEPAEHPRNTQRVPGGLSTVEVLRPPDKTPAGTPSLRDLIGAD